MIWRTFIFIDRTLFWVLLATVMLGFLGKISLDRPLATGSDGRIRLRPSRLGISLICLVLSWLMLVAARYLQHSGSWFNQDFADLAMIPVAGLVFIELLIETPGTIVIDDEGLEQVYWFRRNIRIRWEKIVEIDSGPKDRKITITGEDGTWIAHSAFLSGRSRLLIELKRHCGNELPADFPREPLSDS